jgi:hypothetical protein
MKREKPRFVHLLYFRCNGTEILSLREGECADPGTGLKRVALAIIVALFGR